MTDYIDNLKQIVGAKILSIWRYIENKYDEKGKNSGSIFNRIRYLRNSSHKLQKTKLLILFSLYVYLITTIDFGLGIYFTYLQDIYSLFTNKLDNNVKVLFSIVIPIIGFVGSRLLIARNKLGVWVVGTWIALLIIPIYLSYDEKGYEYSKNITNFLNYFGRLDFYIFTSSKTIGNQGIDYMIGVNYYITYNSLTKGLGINFIAITYLFILLIIIWKNKNIVMLKFSIFIVFSSYIIFVACTPYFIVKSIDSHEENIVLELNAKALEFQVKTIYNDDFKKQDVADRCKIFSKSFFINDNHNYIKKIECGTGDKKTTYVSTDFK